MNKLFVQYVLPSIVLLAIAWWAYAWYYKNKYGKSIKNKIELMKADAKYDARIAAAKKKYGGPAKRKKRVPNPILDDMPEAYIQEDNDVEVDKEVQVADDSHEDTGRKLD